MSDTCLEMDTNSEVIAFDYNLVDRNSIWRTLAAGDRPGRRAAARAAAHTPGCPAPLEVCAQAHEHETAKRVIDLWVGPAVAEAGGAVRRAGDRRILVEDVVHADPEVQVVVDGEIRRQVEIAP